MTSHRFDMWQDQRKVLLSEVVGRLSTQCKIIWSLHEIYATGVAPEGKSMVEFEDEVRRTPAGYSFSQDALKELSDGLTDLYDLRLVGKSGGREVVEILAVDSSWWEVKLDESCIAFEGRDLGIDSGSGAL